MNRYRKKQLEKIKGQIFDATIQGVSNFCVDVFFIRTDDKIVTVPITIESMGSTDFNPLVELHSILEKIPHTRKAFVCYLKDVSPAEAVYLVEKAFSELFEKKTTRFSR